MFRNIQRARTTAATSTLNSWAQRGSPGRFPRNIVLKGCRMELYSNSKVGEITAASMAAIQVFEDFGIDYCCGGEQSIAEACRSGGVDPETLLQAVRDTTIAAPSGSRDWKTEPLSALIGHIVSVQHK